MPACQGKCIPSIHLTLCFKPDAPEDHWRIDHRDGRMVIEAGLAKLAELERGIDDISRGRGDWAMHGGSKSLWFWW